MSPVDSRMPSVSVKARRIRFADEIFSGREHAFQFCRLCSELGEIARRCIGNIGRISRCAHAVERRALARSRQEGLCQNKMVAL